MTVVSAAHCFQTKYRSRLTPKEHVNVFVGKHNLSVEDERNAKLYEVQQIIIHPDWNYTERKYIADISLIVLFDEVTFTDVVRPICLPMPSNEDPFGFGTVVGWGLSEYSGLLKTRMDPTPNELETPIVSAKECFNDFPKLAEITSMQSFCAGYRDQTKSVCSGDSGGGLFSIHSESGRYYVKGIVSAALLEDKTCNKEVYSIFTDVASFSKWIKDLLEESLVWNEIGIYCEIINGFQYPTCQHNSTGSMTTSSRIGDVSGSVDINTDEVAFNFNPATEIYSGVGKKFPELRILYINFTPLMFIQRRDFENLPKLKKLEMIYNQIEFLPEDVFYDLYSIETLILNGNGIKNLPEKIFKNSENLKEINLDDNMIQHLPKELFKYNEKIRDIKISGNKLTSVATDFTKLTNIKSINLDTSQCVDFSVTNGIKVNELQKNIDKNCAKQPDITESDIEYIGAPQIFPEKTLESTVKCGEKFITAANGTKIEQNRWPWLVAFFYWPKREFICSGSLISSRHVLTGKKNYNLMGTFISSGK